MAQNHLTKGTIFVLKANEKCLIATEKRSSKALIRNGIALILSEI